MKRNISLFYITQSSALLTLLAAYPAAAQIIPDGTVNTTVTPTGNINVIEGGTRAGTNLFHSFQEFSVPTGREAFFNNAFDIRNIFSRVTGKLPSNIDGLIRANGVANLFLLNPNGIIFGPNARLNIGGSFLATTANSFKFADGVEFSATNPQAAPLLSINVPIGLQMGSNPGNITIEGKGLNPSLAVEEETTEQRAARLIAFEQDFLSNPQGLLVQPGRTIALVGGNLTFKGGIVGVRQGSIELGSVNSGVVSLNPTETGLTLGYENATSFGEIQMSQSSAVATSGEGAGEIRVRGGKITLNERSKISANTIGNQNGGGVTVEAQQLSLFGGSSLVSGTFSSGDAGNLIVNAKDSIEVSGISPDGQFLSYLQTSSLGVGQAGNIIIETGELIVRDGAQISTSTFGKGKAGNLTVKARDVIQVIGTSTNGEASSILGASAQPGSTGDGGNLTIETGQLIVKDGAQISAGTFGKGKAGNLTVKVRDVIQVIGIRADGKAASSLRASAETGSTGDGGILTIETGELIVKDGAQIGTATFGKGKAGNFTVVARDVIQVIGVGSVLSASANKGSTGDGGNITIETGELIVKDGAQIITATFGKGKGGNLTVKARDVIQVIGTSADGRFISGLGASADKGSTGDGGNLTIETGELIVKDGAQILASTLGKGKAGDLTVKARDMIQVIGTSADSTFISSLRASAAEGSTGDGGNLTIETGELIVKDGAQILASTFGKGKAGNLTVKARDVIEVIGISADGKISSILDASAAEGSTGDGGNLTIETGELIVKDGAQILASTFGKGKAGNLTVKAHDVIQVIGIRADGKATSSLRASAETGSTGGDGGNLTIETGELVVKDGAQIGTSTFGKGKAGNLTVKARDVIQVIGTSADGNARSALAASAEAGSTGDGGNLTIETGELIVKDGSTLTVSGLGKGKAGTLQVYANSLELSNKASLIANTSAGGGSIELQVPLIILRSSNITTNATGKATGGNITINTDVLAALENSDISANAEDSFGGRVIINAQGIFGTKFRPDTTPESDITATSKLGPQFSGTVEINTPEVDPNSGLVNLPENAVDVSRLVPKGCVARRKETGTFYITGNGGFQYRPGDGLMSPLPTGEVRSIPENNSSERSEVNDRIIEAQGIYKLENGQMVLGWECPK
ncbi:filamentous hemagglutinin N-terminal domain-containing protein [Floridanema evergladense]|uniref:Filamentous hemagglutinin N-terminal domain-containing protein n=1 Tax=Floridaenema evergladense BLCC-F167 TaxID=3153639 RepID=A0ABV4WMF7_9CYAN